MMDQTALIRIILEQQKQLAEQELLLKQQIEQTKSLSNQVELLIEQVRIANQNRFGKKTERLDAIDGQLSLFNEAEVTADPNAPEPELEEVVVKAHKRTKKKGKRDEDLSGFPTEQHMHPVPLDELNAYFGEGNWRKHPDETFKNLRFEPASYTVEEHTVEVYTCHNISDPMRRVSPAQPFPGRRDARTVSEPHRTLPGRTWRT